MLLLQELPVTESPAEASRMLAGEENSVELRQIQALLDISREEGSMVIVSPVGSGMEREIAAATAGNQVNM